MRNFYFFLRVVAPYAGAWIEKVPVGAGHLQTFLCERKIYFFSPCVKYVFDCHRPALPSFSGFFALFGAGRRFPKSPYLGVDGTAIRIAWLFVPVFVVACEESCNKSRSLKRTSRSA